MNVPIAVPIEHKNKVIDDISKRLLSITAQLIIRVRHSITHTKHSIKSVFLLMSSKFHFQLHHNTNK